MNSAPPHLSRLVFGIVLIVIAFVTAFVWFFLAQSRIQYAERAAIASQNLAQVLELQVNASLGRIDNSLRSINDVIVQNLSAGRKLSDQRLNGVLTQYHARMLDVDRLLLADHKGRVIASSGFDAMSVSDVGDREYFRRTRDDNYLGLVIGGSRQGENGQPRIVSFARRISALDGSFAGVLIAVVETDRFAKVLSRLDIGSNGVVSILDGDMRIVARRSPAQSVKPEETSEADFLRSASRGGDATSGVPMKMVRAGSEHTISLLKSPDWPVYVSVDLLADDYLAHWRNEVRVALATLMAFLIVLSAGARLIFVAWRAQLNAKAEYLRSLQFSEALLNAIPVPVFFKDRQGRYLGCNPAFSEVFGVSQNEIVGKTVHELWPSQFSDVYKDKDDELLSSPAPQTYESVVRNKHGETRHVLFAKNTFFNENREVEGLIGAFIDITDRKLADQHLRIAATAFQAQEGMMVTDAARKILRVNRAFTEITGYSAEEAVGQTPRLLKSGRQDDAFYAAMTQSLLSQGSWQGEIWNRRKNGESYPEWLTITAVKDDSGEITNYVATLTDITERKAAEAEINSLAFYDSLTGLPNRRLLLDRLKHAMASSARSAMHGALLFIDLDNFKTLNDTLGHDIGDKLLQQVAQRLTACVREDDTVARLGGDEFLLLVEHLGEDVQEAASQAEAVAEKILRSLNRTYHLESYEHASTPSIGVTLFVDHQTSIDELLKRADLAMYQAKTAGRNTVRFFDPKMQAAVTTRAALEGDLREAVLKDQFVLHYQPQVDGKGRLTGVEALVRWQHPRHGLVSPAEFIPLAEETGAILPLGHWVLQTACTQLALWAARPEMAHLTVAVNVSARQLHHSDFVDQVLAVLDHTGADPYRLKLELTESLLVRDVEGVIAKMTALKARGVGFSLDDFGTGYSSLSYLKRLPLDQLKIDQGFVRDILTDPNDAAIAKMVIALSESLGLTALAEGVELEAQSAFLSNSGCHAYQGFLFGRPLPLEEFESFASQS